MADDLTPKWHPYQGWLLQISPLWHGFVFNCYPAEATGSWQNQHIYLNYDDALLAAKQFVDRQIAVSALQQVLQRWFAQGLISLTEYKKASQLLP
ncbi:hypothetical protein BST81_11175 [Leptolyngbya sp. 'hensonii']|uniref:hypothetical protein n=1 Tax=Leptolyngbya sp. 'hensonii' TaxID=1922337 RepID=UPI00094F8105|nr:hypothetical protein [Leptolyngbya sp. 'hensonii']OLP18349.1 hypothetical protein BST81_11175 [Leptolyngbya sp. 'hensonii']